MRTDTLEGHLPAFIGDMHDALLTWIDKDAGLVEPFDLHRRLAFQLMMRVVCVPEIADNKEFRSRNLGEGAWAGFEGKTDGVAHSEWLGMEPFNQIIPIMRQRAHRSNRRLQIDGKWPRRRKEDQDVLHKLMKERLGKGDIATVSWTDAMFSMFSPSHPLRPSPAASSPRSPKSAARPRGISISSRATRPGTSTSGRKSTRASPRSASTRASTRPTCADA